MTQGPRLSLTSEDTHDFAEFDPRSCRWALELTLEAISQRDDLRPVDAAQVAAVRNLATAVDCDTLNASLWRQYREALNDLVADDTDDSPNSELDDLLAQVRDPEAARKAD